MLEGLETIDWDNLRHAYGPATDVPDLIRDLAASDKAVRDKARYELFGNIHHQSDVYEASAHAVPFLIELLTIPEVQDKYMILALLQALADGYLYLSFFPPRNFYYNYYEYRYQREKLKERDQQRMDWAHQSHEAVLQGVPLYLELLQHEDKQIREVAAYVLSFCFERVTTILPNLQMQADAEHDPVTKATMITAIHHICKVTTQQGGDLPLTQKERASYLQMCLASNRELIVQLVSALALVDLGNLDSVEQLLEIFALAGAELADEFPYLITEWYRESSLVLVIAQTLQPKPERQTQWLLDLLTHPVASIRSEAVWAIEHVCRQRRDAPAQFGSHLVPLIADEDENVRKAAGYTIAKLGKVRRQLIQPLQELTTHSSMPVQEIAKQTLDQIEQIEKMLEPTVTVDRWLSNELLMDKTVEELAEVIAKQLNDSSEQSKNFHATLNTLATMGTAAKSAITVIQQVMEQHHSLYTCIYAARALWRIAGNTEETMPIFLDALNEELCCGNEYVAVACLGEMGRAAQSALPTLHRLAEAFYPSEDSRSGQYVDNDEWLQQLAQQAIMRIEADWAQMG